jgi:hypothetical protein
MNITVEHKAGRSAQPSLMPRARLALWLSAAFAAWCVVQQAVSFRSFVPPVGLVQAAIFGIIAFRIARGSTRALLAAPVAAAVLLLISLPYIISDLGHPGDVVDFAWTLIALPLVISAAVVAFVAWRTRR